MEDVKKYVDFAYLIGGILMAWLGMKTSDAIWGLSRRIPNPEIFADIDLSTVVGIALAVGVMVYLRVNPRIYGWANECGVELKKTVWPGWPETKSNTMVVIVVTFVMGFILWVFDIVWRTVTNILY